MKFPEFQLNVFFLRLNCRTILPLVLAQLLIQFQAPLNVTHLTTPSSNTTVTTPSVPDVFLTTTLHFLQGHDSNETDDNADRVRRSIADGKHSVGQNHLKTDDYRDDGKLRNYHQLCALIE